MKRWLGLKALVHDAIEATTDLIGEGNASVHRSMKRVTDAIGPAADPVDAVRWVVEQGTEGTLTSVNLVQRVVEGLTDAGLSASLPGEVAEEPPIQQRSDIVGTPEWIADAALGAVNGAIGDHLSARGNALDLGLTLRLGDQYLDDTPAALDGTVVVLVHGLGTTEWCWSLHADAYLGDPEATFGSLLARDTASTPLFARYNTGRTVARNGLALAEALEHHTSGASRLVLVGHSMGGLIARAACHAASRAGHGWLERTDLVISLGTPHRGAPLARFGRTATEGLGAVDLPATRILSRILAGRSAGVRDLEHGDVGDIGPDPDSVALPEDRVVPLQPGIRYAFLSATVADTADTASTWLGDLLVQKSSASGPVRHTSFPIETENFPGVLHHQLQVHPAVYAVVRDLTLQKESGVSSTPPGP
ncbi:MAG: GPI inositol-deacylase [Myxococcales bacterium]|nr:GPI inositol-deacylase [Myxococcales bacterium]